MSATTLLGAVGTAAVLGVTHAFEPDHVAGISSVTGQYADSRLSALVGACFSAGHVLLVVVWLALGYVLLGRTSFPALFDTVGTVGVGLALGVLGSVMVVGGLRRLLYAHSHEHEHDGRVHRHVHAHFPLLNGDTHASDDHAGDAHADHASDGHDHGHDVRSYLKTGVVGALFTLSPPLSMIAFSAALFPTHGAGVVVVAVVAYAVAITATMSLLGAGVGGLFGVTDALDVRVYGGAQVLAGLLVVGLAMLTFGQALPVV